MLRGYKYRIYPNEQQRELIEKSFGCCRLVYNLACEIKIEAGKKRKYINAYGLCYQLIDLKKDFKWLNEIDSQALQASVKKIDKSFGNFWREHKKNKDKPLHIRYKQKALKKKKQNPNYVLTLRDEKWYPKFKNKNNRQSFQCPNNKREINWNKSTLTIPKIKDIPITLSRKFEGKIKTVTISRTSTFKYFASILVEQDKKCPKKKLISEDTAIGLDLGLTDFAILSDGEKINNPKYLKSALARLKVLQKRLSRKKKGSENRKKARIKVAKQHEKITNKRVDSQHKLSHRLTHDNQVGTICAESLSVSNMIKNHKLAQAISDAGWSKFINMLKYKCEWYGINFVQIDRFYPSTQECSDCGAINKTLTLKDREWICANCGTLHDRDINSAKVIKKAGLKILLSPAGSGEEPVESPSLEGAVKQECQIVEGNYL